MIFDGREFAKKIEEGLPKNSGKKLAVFLDASNEASGAYTKLKAKMAERLGVEFSIFNFQFSNNFQINKLINDLNNDRTVDGIVIQMPYPNAEFLINLIDLNKDVDGLRDNSPFKPAAARAVIEILNTSPLTPLHNYGEGNQSGEVVVVGSEGFMGKKLMKYLPGAVGMDKDDFDPGELINADVIIGCTGRAGLIRPEMVKNGVIAIDVGYPEGDFDPEVAKKAAFFTPVPGGVGPVTVVMLFANLLEACYNQRC